MQAGSGVMQAETDDGIRPTARGRKSAKKRSAIMRAAIEIINEKSFALATMTEIAASLDLKDATLYYYFPNKQALVYQCHLTSLHRFEVILQESGLVVGLGIDKLRRFLHNFLKDSEDNGQQLYFGDYSYLDAPQRQKIAGWADSLTRQLQQMIDQGISDGSVVQCESALIVQLLLGMLIWLAKWAPRPKDLTLDSLDRAIAMFAFDGIAARPRSDLPAD